MGILFDQGNQGTPVPLRHYLSGHQISTAHELGWGNLENGELFSSTDSHNDDIPPTPGPAQRSTADDARPLARGHRGPSQPAFRSGSRLAGLVSRAFGVSRDLLAARGPDRRSDLTDRVRPLFTPGAMDPELQSARLPPPDHLLNWAAEIQDEHLRRLAAPGALPTRDLLRNDRLQWLLLQEGARDYERMLMVLHAARMQRQDDGYRVERALRSRVPAADLVVVEQGHYRIGSQGEPFAYDNELPPQAVELSGFRIAKRPVSNAEFLAFMAGGGYREDHLWSEEGRRWRDGSGTAAPLHWRRD